VYYISNGHEHNIIVLLIVTAGGGAGGCGQGLSDTNNFNAGCTGATGGSGVVIISYPVSFKRATTTGKDKNY
jgi:hypothetical protein